MKKLNKTEARIQCRLAVEESLKETPSKIRHFPIRYEIKGE